MTLKEVTSCSEGVTVTANYIMAFSCREGFGCPVMTKVKQLRSRRARCSPILSMISYAVDVSLMLNICWLCWAAYLWQPDWRQSCQNTLVDRNHFQIKGWLGELGMPFTNDEWYVWHRLIYAGYQADQTPPCTTFTPVYNNKYLTKSAISDLQHYYSLLLFSKNIFSHWDSISLYNWQRWLRSVLLQFPYFLPLLSL